MALFWCLTNIWKFISFDFKVKIRLASNQTSMGRIELSLDAIAREFGDQCEIFFVSKDSFFGPNNDLMCDPPINYENEWDHVVMKKVIVVGMAHCPSKNEKNKFNYFQLAFWTALYCNQLTNDLFQFRAVYIFILVKINAFSIRFPWDVYILAVLHREISPLRPVSRAVSKDLPNAWKLMT